MASGMIAVERDGGADQRPHGRQAGPFQEPAPVLVGHAPEYQLVGQFRVLVVELEKVDFLFGGKWSVFWHDTSPLRCLFAGRSRQPIRSRINE